MHFRRPSDPKKAYILLASLGFGCIRLACLSAGISFAGSLFAQTVSDTQAKEAKNTKETYLAGLSLAKEGKLDEAIATFQKALENNGQNPSLLNATGAAYSLIGNLEQAKKYFLKCLEEDPGFVPARKNLAITYFSIGQYDLATAEFQKLANISAASGQVANLFLGIIAEKNSNHLQAAKLLKCSGELLKQYPEAILSLAQAELELNHLREAEDILAKFDTAREITASQYLKAAKLFLRLGQGRKALQELDTASAKAGRLDGVAYQRALVLDEMNRSREALTILNDLAAKTPDSDTLHLLAHVAQKTGDLGLALQSLRRAAKMDPAREDNYLDFSSICADYENYPLALEAANVGLEHVPNSYRLLIQKGVVLENLGRFEEAENILRQASQLQKDNSEAFLSLAIVQTHAGQLEDAEVTLTSALHNFPDNYYMHYQLGKLLVHFQEGNPNDADLSARAKHALQQAIRCKPSFADSYYQLSKLYLRESPKLAEQNLAKCLQLDPNHAPAEYALARLYLSTGRRAAGQSLIDRFERQRQADKLKENHKPRIELAQK